MTIATDYLETAGETVGQACLRLHRAGMGIDEAARFIGYASATELRNYLVRRGLVCPWLPRRDGRGHPPIRIEDAVLERYAEMVMGEGRSKAGAARALGWNPESLNRSVQRRRPDLAQRLRSR